jgi:hypothetical protein
MSCHRSASCMGVHFEMCRVEGNGGYGGARASNPVIIDVSRTEPNPPSTSCSFVPLVKRARAALRQLPPAAPANSHTLSIRQNTSAAVGWMGNDAHGQAA